MMGEAEAVVAAMTALMQDCTECIAKMMGNTSEAVVVVEEAVSLLNSVEVAEVGAEDMKNLAAEAAEAAVLRECSGSSRWHRHVATTSTAAVTPILRILRTRLRLRNWLRRRRRRGCGFWLGGGPNEDCGGNGLSDSEVRGSGKKSGREQQRFDWGQTKKLERTNNRFPKRLSSPHLNPKTAAETQKPRPRPIPPPTDDREERGGRETQARRPSHQNPNLIQASNSRGSTPRGEPTESRIESLSRDAQIPRPPKYSEKPSAGSVNPVPPPSKKPSLESIGDAS
ncbi:hypothetical protein NL676_026923 [Syzygium grande]|nr:hypothetical protein NL676_026923 [Syzygium grande]